MPLDIEADEAAGLLQLLVYALTVRVPKQKLTFYI